jgi:hypothetical protein
MNDAALPVGDRKYVRRRFYKASAGVGDNEPQDFKSALFEMQEKAAPAHKVFLRHPQLHFPGLRLKLALEMAGSAIYPLR